MASDCANFKETQSRVGHNLCANAPARFSHLEPIHDEKDCERYEELPSPIVEEKQEIIISRKTHVINGKEIVFSVVNEITIKKNVVADYEICRTERKRYFTEFQGERYRWRTAPWWDYFYLTIDNNLVDLISMLKKIGVHCERVKEKTCTFYLYKVRVDSAKHIAEGKGVHREVESEGSHRRTSGLTNRNHIRHCKLGNVIPELLDRKGSSVKI